MQTTRREVDHARLSDEVQDLRRRTSHLETEVGLLPIKALIVLIWLLAVVGYASAIGFAVSH